LKKKPSLFPKDAEKGWVVLEGRWYVKDMIAALDTIASALKEIVLEGKGENEKKRIDQNVRVGYSSFIGRYTARTF